ncbi:hypothetical protein CC78DRAFT_574522 [Lojkania enalia]|uniref:Uncharacterized protein n=1 Tax=Lojkania enalia TaxID=147567 RepID=A0A9P4NAP1_9PLEO|nr:hypothetical protein CC78DRAFT_574522 [Didymosphaeria enalia]
MANSNDYPKVHRKSESAGRTDVDGRSSPVRGQEKPRRSSLCPLARILGHLTPSTQLGESVDTARRDAATSGDLSSEGERIQAYASELLSHIAWGYMPKTFGVEHSIWGLDAGALEWLCSQTRLSAQWLEDQVTPETVTEGWSDVRDVGSEARRGVPVPEPVPGRA